MSWCIMHGKRLLPEKLPPCRKVNFRNQRKKYTAYGWWSRAGAALNMVVVRAAGKDAGLINQEVPVPGGSFPRTASITEPVGEVLLYAP